MWGIVLNKKNALWSGLMLLFFLSAGCRSGVGIQNANSQKTDSTIYKVTFIELGSVRCIPCQQMQAVMKSIEKKYGTEVKIVFHDVWTDSGAPFAKKYGIEAIPTQIFLDDKGTEFFRHTGYFPEEKLVEVLKSKGVQ